MTLVEGGDVIQVSFPLFKNYLQIRFQNLQQNRFLHNLFYLNPEIAEGRL